MLDRAIWPMLELNETTPKPPLVIALAFLTCRRQLLPVNTSTANTHDTPHPVATHNLIMQLRDMYSTLYHISTPPLHPALLRFTVPASTTPNLASPTLPTYRSSTSVTPTDGTYPRGIDRTGTLSKVTYRTRGGCPASRPLPCHAPDTARLAMDTDDASLSPASW